MWRDVGDEPKLERSYKGGERVKLLWGGNVAGVGDDRKGLEVKLCVLGRIRL